MEGRVAVGAHRFKVVQVIIPVISVPVMNVKLGRTDQHEAAAAANTFDIAPERPYAPITIAFSRLPVCLVTSHRMAQFSAASTANRNRATRSADRRPGR